jgi:uncharacterized DUF497 family protein
MFVWLERNIRATVEPAVATFEWDPAKDVANRRKHGVSFADAQLAFLDPRRVIARDVVHSVTEERHYCIGCVARRIMTVRFTWREGVIRIIGAGYWRAGRELYEARAQGDR